MLLPSEFWSHAWVHGVSLDDSSSLDMFIVLKQQIIHDMRARFIFDELSLALTPREAGPHWRMPEFSGNGSTTWSEIVDSLKYTLARLDKEVLSNVIAK